MKPEFWGKMLPHLFSADWYIGGWALLTGVLLFVVRLKARDVLHWFSEAPSARSLNTLVSSRRRLSIFYTLFTTCISIFPLLGMFGTVQALVGLDLTGDMEGVKQHFFEALTSTAWGIIFAVIFKVLHAAFAAHDAEEMLAKSGRFLDARERPGAARQEDS